MFPYRATLALKHSAVGLVFFTMAAAKPPGRPKLSTNEVLDLTNLHLDWDNNPEIRERLLDAQDLLVDDGCDDIPTAKKQHTGAASLAYQDEFDRAQDTSRSGVFEGWDRGCVHEEQAGKDPGGRAEHCSGWLEDPKTTWVC